jgi:hypothetical protein
VLAATVGAVGVAGAQPEEALKSVDVSQCVGLATPEERLACFEARVEAAGGGPAAGGAPAAASGTAAAASSSRGRGGQDDLETPAPPDIHAKVATLRETVPNSYLITLDNGQVWRQTVPEAYPLRPGSDVRIYVSKWRTFRLSSPVLRGFIQVERVR